MFFSQTSSVFCPLQQCLELSQPPYELVPYLNQGWRWLAVHWIVTPKIKWLWDSQRSAALLWAPQTKHHQKSQRPVSQNLSRMSFFFFNLAELTFKLTFGGVCLFYNKSIFEHLCLACVCVLVIGGVHLCNPDLVRQSALDCGWTQPLVTYYYSFSCRSKYWFIKGFSIWAPWHVVKYHQVCRSEQRDREGGGQVGSPGIVDHPLPHPPTRAPRVLIYLSNSKTLHFYQFEAIEWSMSSYSTLNYWVLLFIFGLSDPLIPVLICSLLLSLVPAHSWNPHSGTCI